MKSLKQELDFKASMGLHISSCSMPLNKLLHISISLLLNYIILNKILQGKHITFKKVYLSGSERFLVMILGPQMKISTSPRFSYFYLNYLTSRGCLSNSLKYTGGQAPYLPPQVMLTLLSRSSWQVLWRDAVGFCHGYIITNELLLVFINSLEEKAPGWKMTASGGEFEGREPRTFFLIQAMLS